MRLTIELALVVLASGTIGYTAGRTWLRRHRKTSPPLTYQGDEYGGGYR